MAPIIAGYWERAAFPFELVPKLAKLNLGGANLKGYGCPGQSIMGAAMAVIEIARIDASMSTFLMVHNSLAMLTLGAPYIDPWPTLWICTAQSAADTGSIWPAHVDPCVAAMCCGRHNVLGLSHGL